MDEPGMLGSGTGAEPSPDHGHGYTVEKHSCIQCRQRKIRCDRVRPCRQCSDRNIQCTFPAARMPRTKRKRNHPPNEEIRRKIDELSEKIDRITATMGNVQTFSGSTSQSPNNAFPLRLLNASPSTEAIDQVVASTRNSSRMEDYQASQSSSESYLEDDDHLASQALFVTEHVQLNVENNLFNVPEQVRSSLDALKRIVGRHDEQTTNSKPDFSQISVSKGDLKLPPVWLTMLAIQKVKDTPALDISCLHAFSDVSHFIDYLLNGYSEKASLIDLVILHCGLYEIFIRYQHIETDSALKEELLAATSQCRHNLGQLLANLPLNLPCNIHTIRALLMTAYYHLGECEISLAWSHIASAAQLCFRLRLHTNSHFGHGLEDTRSSNARLFWLIYMIDKVVSLRLNRPFCIDDRNVSVGLDCIEAFEGKRLCVVVPKWIKMSMIYGKVYLDLYSAKALLDTQDAREARARSLADELKTLFYSRDSVEDRLFENMDQKLGAFAVDIQRNVDLVSHLSCLTLIYRSIQPTGVSGSAFSEECLMTARECLQKQRICLAQLDSALPFSLDIYIEWAVMGWPFVPFVVVFCNTIETLDSSGLAELRNVIEPLKLVESILPISYKKQLRLLVVMYDVANKYISSQSDALSATYMEPSFETPFNLLFSQVGMPVLGYETQMQQDFHVSSDDRIAEQTARFAPTAAAQANYRGLQDIDYGSQLGYWLECNQKLLQSLEHRF